MDPDIYDEYIVLNSSQLPSKKRNTDPKPVVFNKNNIASIISTTFFIISSAIFNLNEFYDTVLEPVEELYLSPFCAIEYTEMPIEQWEEWKENEWKNWKIGLEEDWEAFHDAIQNEKNKWFEGIEKEWENWMKTMEQKLKNFSEHINNTYPSITLKTKYDLDESHWEQLIKSEGKQLMEIEWNNWIYHHESFLNVWCLKAWLKWKNDKIVQWLQKDWKLKEDAYWQNWEKMWRLVGNPTDRTNWLKWRKRNDNQIIEWNLWVTTKEKLYINHKWDKWINWKNDKNILFHEWMECFINKWIGEKKWNMFVSIGEQTSPNKRKTFTAHMDASK